MAILPGLDAFAEQYGYSDAQKNWIAASQYLMIALILFVLAWLLYNAWNLLIRRGKYKVVPLIIFYIVAITLVLERLYDHIGFWALITNQRVLPLLMHQTLKFVIGLDQAWVNLELCLSIRYNLKKIEKPQDDSLFPQRLIKNGRIILAIVIVCFCTLMFCFFEYHGHNASLEERERFIEWGLSEYVTTLQITNFVLLSTSIAFLFYLLRRMQRHMSS